MSKFRSKIFIAHQYGDESHFKALYDNAKKYGYMVSDQIILNNGSLKYKIKQAFLQKHYLRAFSYIFNRINFYFLRKKILIVGLAPYDDLMLKYEPIFKRNRCFYMTSWTTWDGTNFPRGSISNKQDYERILKTCFEGAFCVSQKCSNNIKPIISNTSVVNHAISYAEYKKKKIEVSNPQKQFLFIGQYIERKNIRLILSYMEYNKNPNIKMTFIGSGELEELINNHAKTDSRIVNKGFLSKKQLQNTLCTYDFLVLPSKAEPFGIVLLEALACGVPCIVSDADGPREIITDNFNGLVFSLSDSQNNFNSIMERGISLSSEEYFNMSKNALDSGKKYDSDSVILNWLNLLCN